MPSTSLVSTPSANSILGIADPLDITQPDAIQESSNEFNAGDATAQLWKQFQESTVPRLKDIESQIAQRQGNFVDEATNSANKSIAMAKRQGEVSREALGIQLTPEEQEATDRLGVLGGASSLVAAQNDAVDVADSVNKNQAAALTSVQTGLTQESLQNLQGAANLQDARGAGDSARRTASSNQNTQTAGTAIGMIAAMFM